MDMDPSGPSCQARQISFLSSSEGLNKMFLEAFKLKKVKLEIYKTLSFYFLFLFLIKKKKEKKEEEGKTEKLIRGVWTKNWGFWDGSFYYKYNPNPDNT